MDQVWKQVDSIRAAMHSVGANMESASATDIAGRKRGSGVAPPSPKRMRRGPLRQLALTCQTPEAFAADDLAAILSPEKLDHVASVAEEATAPVVEATAPVVEEVIPTRPVQRRPLSGMEFYKFLFDQVPLDLATFHHWSYEIDDSFPLDVFLDGSEDPLWWKQVQLLREAQERNSRRYSRLLR